MLTANNDFAATPFRAASEDTNPYVGYADELSQARAYRG